LGLEKKLSEGRICVITRGGENSESLLG